MIYTALTKKAMKLCFEKHKDQADKCGIPYPFHPFHVAESMQDEETACVALLHDILEDTDTTKEKLLSYGFGEKIVNAVACLTHDERIPYLDYVREIKKNPIARAVKIADLKHNSDLTRLDKVTEEDFERVKKYKEALAILEED